METFQNNRMYSSSHTYQGVRAFRNAAFVAQRRRSNLGGLTRQSLRELRCNSVTEDQAKVQTASPEELERVEEGATAKPQIPKTGEVVSGKGSTEPGKREGSKRKGNGPREIKLQLEDLKVNEWYDGTVRSATTFGVFFDIGAAKDGLCHVSQLSDSFVEDATKFFNVGETKRVKVLSVEKGKLALSLLDGSAPKAEGRSQEGGRGGRGGGRGGRGGRGGGRGGAQRERAPQLQIPNVKVDDKVKGTISRIERYGLFITVEEGKKDGLLHVSDSGQETPFTDLPAYSIGHEQEAWVSSVDPEKGQLGLSLLSPDQREVERRMSKKGASVSTDDNQKRRPGAGSLAAALKAAGLTKLGSVPASQGTKSASNGSGSAQSDTPPVLATQVLEEDDLPNTSPASGSGSGPEDASSSPLLTTQVLDDAQTPRSAQDKQEPAVLEKSDEVPATPEDVELDPTAVPGGGLAVDPALDPKEKARKRAEDAASSPAKDLIQSFDEKDISGSKVGSNPATGHPESGGSAEGLTNLDKNNIEDSTPVEDKIEAVAAALSRDEEDENQVASPSAPAAVEASAKAVTEGLAKLDGGKSPSDDTKSVEQKIEEVAQAISRQHKVTQEDEVSQDKGEEAPAPPSSPVETAPAEAPVSGDLAKVAESPEAVRDSSVASLAPSETPVSSGSSQGATPFKEAAAPSGDLAIAEAAVAGADGGAVAESPPAQAEIAQPEQSATTPEPKQASEPSNPIEKAIATASEVSSSTAQTPAKAGPAISSQAVKSLRDQTGAGMMDCKKALKETNGDVEKAVTFLRKKGLAGADKKAGRVTTEGLVSTYIHAGSGIGVLIEVNCETDFVARGDVFKGLCTDLAMQVAAFGDVVSVSTDDIPQEVLDKEFEIEMGKDDILSKPEDKRAMIVQGRISKNKKKMSLMDQPYIKDNSKTVQTVVKETIAQLGENISVRRFDRFILGEGIEKKQADLAKDVEEQTNKMKEEAAARAASTEQQADTPPEPTDEQVAALKVSAKQVQELRKVSGAGMMDCKRALAASDGDVQKASDYLRKKGLASADKKAGRATSEGAIVSYIHGGRLGILAEVNCETDFVARGEVFQTLASDIAMQLASNAQVESISKDEFPQELLEAERQVALQMEDLQKKPENIREKIVEGRLNKFAGERALLEQDFIKDPKKSVGQHIKETISTIGENITVRRFVRYNLGEGLQKKEENFAEEIAKATGKA